MVKFPLLKTAAGLIVLAAISACSQSEETTNSSVNSTSAQKAETTARTKTAETTPESIMDEVLASPHRAEQAARDKWRHPKETLAFFGATPDQTIVEMFPGGGWYANVIAPFVAKGKGTYVAVNFNPGDNENRLARLQTFKDNYADKDLYGDVQFGLIGRGAQMVEPGSADMVLTFRNVHNWMAGDIAQDFFNEFYTALKPGGVLGVVEHRGDSSVEQDPKARSGYVNEETVIAFALAAGFELEGKSEINANPADTRDHPFGVWTLPPVKRSSATRGETDPDFDRAKYDAIGESDRLTIKFRKPLADEGALLE